MSNFLVSIYNSIRESPKKLKNKKITFLFWMEIIIGLMLILLIITVIQVLI